MQETILTNGTPAVSRAGKQITLSSTITSGRVRATISASCSWQYRAPLISSAQTGLIQVSSCSMVGLRNSGAVLAMNSFQNAPASWPARPAGPARAGGDRSTRSSSKPSGSSRPFHEASAANTTRCPRRRSTSPMPMQLLVGPYALSGMNRTVRGLPGMPAPSGTTVGRSGQYVRCGRPGAGLPAARPVASPCPPPGCSTRASTRLAMNRAVRTTVPPRVTSMTSTTPRPVTTSTRRPARVAVTSYVRDVPPASMTISTRSPFTA